MIQRPRKTAATNKPTDLKQKATLTVLCLWLTFCLFAQAPTPNFTSNTIAGCSPIVVNFQDQSTGNPTSWFWDLGTSTSTLQNPSATYFNPGTYTIKLVATNASGSDSIIKTAYITVYEPPVAGFGADKRLACFPAVINFSDSSTTPPGSTITSWNWDFGDGNTSTLQAPQYVYRNAGNYTVSLQITNDKGCTKVITKPNYIQVTQGVVPRISFSNPNVCSAPATVEFKSTSTGPPVLSYAWNFGNGLTSTSQNESVVFATNGTYTVKLTVTSSAGCTDSTSTQIDIGKVTTDILISEKICPESLVQFINNSTPRPISAYWQFSNGFTDTLRNTATSFATGGTYTVTLINTYAVCIDTFDKQFTVLDAPFIDFSSNNNVSCKPPLTVNFTNNSNGASYLWNFGDGSTATQPPHTYTTYGLFDVSLIATGINGCVDTLIKPAFVKIQKPVISFPTLPSAGCLPYPYTFNADIIAADSVISYLWQFGDGTTSTEKTPSHVYTQQGAYTVTLTITTSTGCTETYALPDAIKVGTKPVASFTAAPLDVCASQPIQFFNTSQNVDNWLWLFGDGGISNVRDPLYKFRDTGLLYVKLIVYNFGCPSDTLVKDDYVHIKPPVAAFRYRPDCNNRLRYTFENRSIADPLLSPLTWRWDFGDGSPVSTDRDPPVHIYAGFGTYTVTLISTNGDCADTVKRIIIIRDLTPDFTSPLQTGCKAFTATINAAAPNPGLIRNYIWDFGDGIPRDFGTSPVGQFTYTFAGTYNVTLTTIDSFGCAHSFTKNAFIRVSGPTADFTSTTNTGCKGLITTFIDATTTDGQNGIVSWVWNFGDGSPVQTFTAPPFTHTYDSIADFNVTLTVTDANGCTSTKTYLAFVKLSAIRAVWSTPGETCPGGTLNFFNKSESDFPYTSIWTFGDGQSTAIINPALSQSTSHVYAATGLYTVKLKVRDLFGCEDSASKANVVEVSLPVASFDVNALITYCTPFEAKFTNTSTFYRSSKWDFGAGVSTLQNPSFYFTQKGIYPVKLTVTSPGGCTDDTTVIITVNNPEDGKIDYSPLSGCKPVTVTLKAFTQMNARFIWDFGDGNVIDTTANELEHIYTDFGSFVPKIILKELGTPCTFPVTGAQPINLLGVTTKYTLENLFYCDSGFVTIKDSTTYNDPVTEYKWDFGDGTTFNAPDPGGHQYTKPGLYNVSLIVNTQAGCTDTLQKGPVKIVESPLIRVETDTVICVNDTLTHFAIMERADTSVVRWLWTFPNGNTSTLQAPVVQKYTTAGTFNITTIATNSSGCADTVVKSFLVNPLPVITLPPQLTKVVGNPLTLPATYSSGVVSYLWTPAQTLSCADCPQPVTTTKFNTRYFVTATDSNACINRSTIEVIVLCQGNKIFLPNTFSPNGDGTNDVFYARGTGLDRVKSLRIFNRWGEVVFEQRDFPVNNAANGWNGMYKGKKALPDVYIYQVEIFCENSELIRFEGNIALIQ